MINSMTRRPRTATARTFSVTVMAIAVAAVSWSATSTALAGTTRRVFAVGNSLTADSTVWNNGDYSYAAARGDSLTLGYSLRWGMGMTTQWNDYVTGTQTTDTVSVSNGFFQTALTANTWDAITLQPFANALSDEMSAAKNIVDIARWNGANRNVDLYLYAPWPGQTFDVPSQLTFATGWQQPYTGQVVGNFSSKDYFHQAFNALKSAYPNNNVRFIPAGEVFEELVGRINAGEIGGVSDPHALYIDGLHASVGLGRYAASVTYFATVFSEDPRGLPIPEAYQPDVTPTIAKQIQDSVWHVLTSQAINTGVWAPGDTTGDGNVNFADLLVLAKNYGSAGAISAAHLNGDVNSDGNVNFADLLILAKNYGQSSLPGASISTASPATFQADWALAQSLAPEPASLATLAAAVMIGATSIRRRRTGGMAVGTNG